MRETYLGPAEDIGDLPFERMQPGQVRSVWEPSPDERSIIATGGNIEVTIWGEPIPPLMVNATEEGT